MGEWRVEALGKWWSGKDFSEKRGGMLGESEKSSNFALLLRRQGSSSRITCQKLGSYRASERAYSSVG